MIARLRLELKSQRLLYAVPIVVIWILVPLVVYSNYLASDGDLFITRLFAINSAQQFIPLFAVWYRGCWRCGYGMACIGRCSAG